MEVKKAHYIKVKEDLEKVIKRLSALYRINLGLSQNELDMKEIQKERILERLEENIKSLPARLEELKSIEARYFEGMSEEAFNDLDGFVNGRDKGIRQLSDDKNKIAEYKECLNDIETSKKAVDGYDVEIKKIEKEIKELEEANEKKKKNFVENATTFVGKICNHRNMKIQKLKAFFAGNRIVLNGEIKDQKQYTVSLNCLNRLHIIVLLLEDQAKKEIHDSIIGPRHEMASKRKDDAIEDLANQQTLRDEALESLNDRIIKRKAAIKSKRKADIMYFVANKIIYRKENNKIKKDTQANKKKEDIKYRGISIGIYNGKSLVNGLNGIVAEKAKLKEEALSIYEKLNKEVLALRSNLSSLDQDIANELSYILNDSTLSIEEAIESIIKKLEDTPFSLELSKTSYVMRKLEDTPFTL